MKTLTVALVLPLLLLGTPLTAQDEKPPAPDPVEGAATDPAGSESLLKRASSDDTRRINKLQRSAKRNIETKRWPRAIDDVKDLIALAPYDADYQLTLGLLYRKQNDLEESRRKFREFLDLGGSQAVGHMLIGETFASVNDREKVILHLRKAAESGMNLLKVQSQIPTLETFMGDTEFIKLALQLEKYELDVAELDDPFTDRFKRSSSDEDDGGKPIGPVGLSKEQQEEVLRQAQIYIARIERALTQEDEKRAMEAYTQLLELTNEQDRFTVPRLAAEFRGIVSRKEEIEARIEEIRLKYHYRQAQEIIAQMRRAFKDQDYPRVEVLYGDIEEVARKMIRVNSDFREVTDTITTVGKNWVNRAQVRREFNSKPLKIEGIILHVGDPYCIVNGTLLRVGDKFEGMRVIQVEPNQVYFEFKGEKIPKVFRRF